MNTVTEAEAAKKSCVNWMHQPTVFIACQGAGCMAWRWANDGFEYTKEWEGHSEQDNYWPPIPNGEGWVLCDPDAVLKGPPAKGSGRLNDWKRPMMIRKGFCGLAEPRVEGMV